jgi:7-cyano-7-deazaguanine reductase
MLEVFPSPHHHEGRDAKYVVEITFPEFTSLCPKTGQPDFGEIKISYIPFRHCIESKSLKLYFFAYRQHGAFMEKIVNKILGDLVYVSLPRWMRVEGKFNARGGTFITVVAEHTKTPVAAK